VSRLEFHLPTGARVLFTTRAEGNLSSVGGVGAEHGRGAREALRERIGMRALARGFQVHGADVARVLAEPAYEVEQDELAPADGQATALRGVAPIVLTADCLPVALASEAAVAMLHAGWRGLAAGVLEEGVAAMRALGGDADVLAIVGPGAGPCCYEVGPEVRGALGLAGAHRRGRSLDLSGMARDRLLAAGVSNVRELGLCTICDERFFSHRREGSAAGRQGGVAWLS
jgi:purine-nucleoside/S-methyl-5'-thioadenosine phosphorylase / adenosine deaminase